MDRQRGEAGRMVKIVKTEEMPCACPVCYGQGTVSKPPWIAGDVQTWETGDTQLYPCPPCRGTGLVWKQP